MLLVTVFIEPLFGNLLSSDCSSFEWYFFNRLLFLKFSMFALGPPWSIYMHTFTWKMTTFHMIFYFIDHFSLQFHLFFLWPSYSLSEGNILCWRNLNCCCKTDNLDFIMASQSLIASSERLSSCNRFLSISVEIVNSGDFDCATEPTQLAGKTLL